jgi:glucose-1-phosphate cytidylyltransferase
MKYFKTAVILCGGKGTRLGVLGKKTAKTLISVHKKPILWYILKFLEKNAFNHFILPVGFKGDKIAKYIQSNPDFKNYHIDIINTGKNTSIAERIYNIKNYIRSENFLLTNGDAIFDSNIKKIFVNHVKNKIDMSFICSKTQADFGTIAVQNGRILNFKRELVFDSVNIKNKNLINYVYSGMSIMNKKILFKEKFLRIENFEKNFYPKIIKRYRCKVYNLKGFWYAMDSIKDVESANKKNINKNAYNKISQLLKKLNDK